MRATGIWAAVLFATLGAGCTARQVARDGNQFRSAVCDLYAEQALDNLIRARNNQPFVVLTYRDLLVQDTDTLTATAGVSTGLERQTGPLEGIMRTVTSGFTAGGGGTRERILSFHADPVVDRPDVYEAFVRFACDPGLLVESDRPPGCPVHILRKCHKKYYWVPCEAGPTFLNLVMLTSFTPPADAPASPAYDVEIEELEDREKQPDDNFFKVLLKFKDPVPKGEATLLVDVGAGRVIRLTVHPLSDKDAKDKKQEGVQEGRSVQWVTTTVNPTRDGIQPAELKGKRGQLFSHKFPRQVAPPTPPIGQRIYNEVDRIRAAPGRR